MRCKDYPLGNFSLTFCILISFPGNSVLDLCVYKGDFDHKKLDGETKGPENSLEYRINFSHKDKKISPW